MRAARPLLTLSLATALVSIASNAAAVGEGHAGFPNWQERVLLEWTNRARVDPQLEMKKCGAACGEAACFTPQGPLGWNEKANHAARYHSAEMEKQGFFAHDSKCALVSDIATLYPTSCDGSASCACGAGSPTAWNARVALFGVSAQAEIIAGASDPDQAFYMWLFESSSSTACAYSSSNGHRWSLLTQKGALGFGVVTMSTGDFGGAPDLAKIPSGSHYPRSGAVELWANWYDPTGGAPKLALVNVNGSCTPMTKARGLSAGDAAYMAKATVSGCERYYFLFQDASGAQVTYPTTGSLGAGASTCADWDATRPAAGAGCTCTPSCAGKACGDDGCGGSCGDCGAGESCDATGQCVTGTATCDAPKQMCASACVDVQSDPANCSACGSVCDGTCTGGACIGADGGTIPMSGAGGASSSGCGCATAGGGDSPWLAPGLAFALAITTARRRRR